VLVLVLVLLPVRGRAQDATPLPAPVVLAVQEPAPFAGILLPRALIDECNACFIAEQARSERVVTPPAALAESGLTWSVVLSFAAAALVVGFTGGVIVMRVAE